MKPETHQSASGALSPRSEGTSLQRPYSAETQHLPQVSQGTAQKTKLYRLAFALVLQGVHLVWLAAKGGTPALAAAAVAAMSAVNLEQTAPRQRLGRPIEPQRAPHMVADADSAEESLFSCNICYEIAANPVVTLCGHLYCWPCIYRCAIALGTMPCWCLAQA